MKNRLLSFLLVGFGLGISAQNSESTLKVGNNAPSFTLQLGDDSELKSEDLLDDGKSIVLVFYRGNWCPYCNRYLSELSDAQEKIEKAGGLIIAISPESDELQEKVKQETDSKFILAQDKGYHVMEAFGVDFEVSEKMLSKLKKKGHDMSQTHEVEGPVQLPVPATIVINSNGEIAYLHYDTNYKERGDIDEILASLK